MERISITIVIRAAKSHVQATRNGDFHGRVLRQGVDGSTREKVRSALCAAEDLKQDRDARRLEDDAVDREFTIRRVLVVKSGKRKAYDTEITHKYNRQIECHINTSRESLSWLEGRRVKGIKTVIVLADSLHQGCSMATNFRLVDIHV